MAPGLANARPPRSTKICTCPTHGTEKAGKCLAVARRGGGWAHLLMHKKYLLCKSLWPVSNIVLLPFQAGSTVARLQHDMHQHDLVSDVEFNSVEDRRIERLLPKTKHKKIETV